MYSNGAQVYRADLAGYVMETADWENGLISDRVCPVVNVPIKQGQYPKFQKQAGQLLKRTVNKRAPYSGFNRTTMSFDYDTYDCEEYGNEAPVDSVIASDMRRFFDAEVVATTLARRKVLLDQEIRVEAILFNASTFSTTAAATAYTAANAATFDFAQDVDIIKDTLRGQGENPTDIVIPYQVWTRIKSSTIFQNRARGAGFSADSVLQVNQEMASEILELRVHVPRVVYDSAGENVAFSSANVWANTYCWLGKVVPTNNPAGMLLGGTAYRLNWSEYGPPLAVFQYRDEPINSDIIRAAQHCDEKVVNAASARLLATSYS